METSRARLADQALYRRGESITAWARSISVGFGLVALFVLWGSPKTRAVPALLAGLTYIAFPEAPLSIRGDPSLLDHLVRKLVDNALKYSPPGGRVVVRGFSEPAGGTLEVEDSGIGISPEHIPRIFDKFYMVDGGITRRRRGAGVGLYLAREIVRLHKGAIDVRSRPGAGTVFSVRLPRGVPGPSSPEARA